MGGDKIEFGRAEAASALGWWIDAGVDLAIDEQPRNWLAAPAARPSAAAAGAPTPAEAPSPIQVPESLDLFRDWLGSDPSAPLAGSGTKPILPHGPEAASIMLLVGLPEREDASDGRPVGGEAWQLAERMLAAIGIPAEAAYCASLSCFHSPGAKLSRSELEACAEIARRHIALAKPERLLLLGDGPSLALLGKPVATARAHLHKVEGVRTVVTFHPRFLIKQPSNKRLAWQDLLLLMEDEV